jgi:hypothetical protein
VVAKKSCFRIIKTGSDSIVVGVVATQGLQSKQQCCCQGILISRKPLQASSSEQLAAGRRLQTIIEGGGGTPLTVNCEANRRWTLWMTHPMRGNLRKGDSDKKGADDAIILVSVVSVFKLITSWVLVWKEDKTKQLSEFHGKKFLSYLWKVKSKKNTWGFVKKWNMWLLTSWLPDATTHYCEEVEEVKPTQNRFTLPDATRRYLTLPWMVLRIVMVLLFVTLLDTTQRY